MLRKAAGTLATLVAAAGIGSPLAAQQDVPEDSAAVHEELEHCFLYTTIVHHSQQFATNFDEFDMRARVDSLVFTLPHRDVTVNPEHGRIYFGENTSNVSDLALEGSRIEYSADSARIVQEKVGAPFTDEVYLRMKRIGAGRGFLGRITGKATPEQLEQHGELWGSLSTRWSGREYRIPCGRSLGLHENFSDGENDYITVRFENGSN